MSRFNNLTELYAVQQAVNRAKDVEILTRAQKLYGSEKLETKNRQAASKQLLAIQLLLSQNRVK